MLGFSQIAMYFAEQVRKLIPGRMNNIQTSLAQCVTGVSFPAKKVG